MLWRLCNSALGGLACGWAGLEPVGGQQVFELVRGRVVHELFEDPLEPGEGVGSVAADLLDEGVDDGAAPAGVRAADEHPVLVAEFGGADGVFRQVVVEFDPAVQEAGFEVGELLDGVVQRLVKTTARCEAAEADHPPRQFAEVVVGCSGFEPAGALAVEGMGVLCVHPPFDLIDHADEQEDARGDARMLVAGFLELAGDVGEAGYGDDGEFRVSVDEGAVGAQAVALEAAAE